MLNTEKIKWMTRAALYEQKEDRHSLRINRYHVGDYVTWNMVKSLLGATAGFIIAVTLYVLYSADEMLDTLTLEDLVTMGKEFLLLYIFVLIAVAFLSFAVFYSRYHKAIKKTRIYTQYLKKLKRIYQQEETENEQAKEDTSL